MTRTSMKTVLVTLMRAARNVVMVEDDYEAQAALLTSALIHTGDDVRWTTQRLVALLNLAECYRLQGRFEDALSVSEEALELGGPEEAPHATIVRSLVGLGRVGEAEVALAAGREHMSEEYFLELSEEIASTLKGAAASAGE